jgi:transcriptional regulator with XRE-family HTH domain
MAMSDITVRQYRKQLGLSLEAFAALFDKSKGHFSAIETENACAPDLALAIEAHSNGQVNAASLSDTIARARKAVA